MAVWHLVCNLHGAAEAVRLAGKFTIRRKVTQLLPEASVSLLCSVAELRKVIQDAKCQSLLALVEKFAHTLVA